MKNYEAMFIISTALGKEALDNLIAAINDVITKNGGKIENSQNWGRRNLAFRLKKKTEGVYYLVNFKILPDKVARIDEQYRLNESIVRHTIFLKEEVPVKAAK